MGIDQREALEILRHIHVEVGMDARNPVTIAELYLKTGKTALKIPDDETLTVNTNIEPTALQPNRELTHETSPYLADIEPSEIDAQLV